MWVLGIAASHTSAVALIRDGRVVVAVQSERVGYHKGAPMLIDRMGSHACELIASCLTYADLDLPDIDALATSTPWDAVRPAFALSGERNAHGYRLPQLVTVPHHLAQPEYVLHYRDVGRSLMLVRHGSGTYEHQRSSLAIAERGDRATKHVAGTCKECTPTYSFDGDALRLRSRMGAEPVPGTRWLPSIGQLREWAAWHWCGSAQEASKVMSLGTFGDADVHRGLRTLSVRTTGEVIVDLPELVARFDRPNVSEADVTNGQHTEDLAAHDQEPTNNALVDLVRVVQTIDPSEQASYGGGLALNGVANEQVRRRLGIELKANGSCVDNGTAIGAASAVHHVQARERVPEPVNDHYGLPYGSQQIAEALRSQAGAPCGLEHDALQRHVTEASARGALVGWFQGRSELGPPALGNRSILADPGDPLVRDRLILPVSEAFRPPAPAVLEAQAGEHFDLDGLSPVMRRVVPVRGHSLTAVTHVDGTPRVQTMSRQQNRLFHDLTAGFGEVTGVQVLPNTSFDRAGEPIVETPADGLRTFGASQLDMLVMGERVVLPARTTREMVMTR